MKESVWHSSQLIHQLNEQISLVQSELANQKAETAAALAKQVYLDNLVKELRRDNIELRDQLARMPDEDDFDESKDANNSLAESDKPMAGHAMNLKVGLLNTYLLQIIKLMLFLDF